jgi:hypothetical protein
VDPEQDLEDTACGSSHGALEETFPSPLDETKSPIRANGIDLDQLGNADFPQTDRKQYRQAAGASAEALTRVPPNTNLA